jgi:hypothetical protein
MKRALLAITAALALSACAEDLGYGPTFGSGLVYYDSYYGPYYNGYWARDGFFYYAPAPGRPFIRDRDHHFRRDNPGTGFHGERTHPGWVGHHAPGAGTTSQPSGDHHRDRR